MPDTPSAGDPVRTLISVTRAQHDWLRGRAFDRRTSITGEIRELVQAAMDRESPPRKRARRGGSR
ncbi:MAG: hypothetical protein ACYDAC_10205 [Candidatus Dormibacteria bacterium]